MNATANYVFNFHFYPPKNKIGCIKTTATLILNATKGEREDIILLFFLFHCISRSMLYHFLHRAQMEIPFNALPFIIYF